MPSASLDGPKPYREEGPACRTDTVKKRPGKTLVSYSARVHAHPDSRPAVLNRIGRFFLDARYTNEFVSESGKIACFYTMQGDLVFGRADMRLDQFEIMIKRTRIIRHIPVNPNGRSHSAKKARVWVAEFIRSCPGNPPLAGFWRPLARYYDEDDKLVAVKFTRMHEMVNTQEFAVLRSVEVPPSELEIDFEKWAGIEKIRHTFRVEGDDTDYITGVMRDRISAEIQDKMNKKRKKATSWQRG